MCVCAALVRFCCCCFFSLQFVHIFDCSSIRLIVRYVCHRSVDIMWYMRRHTIYKHLSRRTRRHKKQTSAYKKRARKMRAKGIPRAYLFELLPLTTAVACASAIVVVGGDFFSFLYSLLVVSFYVCVCGATAIAPNVSIQ